MMRGGGFHELMSMFRNTREDQEHIGQLKESTNEEKEKERKKE